MIKVNDFKPGTTFLHDKEILIVLESAHAKSGRGQAHVKVKVKNLKTGTIKSITFTGGDVVYPAIVEKIDAQFLYRENENFIFMDNTNYDQFNIDEKRLLWEKNFLIEGDIVKIKIHEGKILGIELKAAITMTVQYTEPAVKGNTASSATKNATLITGFNVQVPLFIEINDKIIINTNDGTYKSRA